MKVYQYTHGACKDEQEFIVEIDTFLVSTLEWTRVGTITDTAVDRDYVWSSPGEDTERDPIYIRLRGNSDIIYEYGYGVWQSAAVYWQEIYDVSYTKLAIGASPFRYWAFGDKNFICIIIRGNATASKYTFIGYLGYIRSYYPSEKDKRPILIHGHPSATYSWDSSNVNYMYTANASGVASYGALNPHAGILIYDQCSRTSSATLWPFPLYYGGVGYKEVRGEPYGVYQVNGSIAGNATHIATASGVFLVHQGNFDSTKTYAYGPIATLSGVSEFEDY